MPINNNPAPAPTTTDLVTPQQPAATKPPGVPGAFRRTMGAVLGGVANIVAPGAGSVIGNLIGGGMNFGGIGSGVSSDSMQMLQMQQQVNAESRQYEMLSNVMKARHDSAMAAIRNMH